LSLLQFAECSSLLLVINVESCDFDDRYSPERRGRLLSLIFSHELLGRGGEHRGPAPAEAAALFQVFSFMNSPVDD
jgi:hypothetical protein